MEGAVGLPAVSSRLAWWTLFTRPGWRHVGILVRVSGDGHWVAVNSLYACVDVMHVVVDVDFEAALRAAGFTTMRVVGMRETRRLTLRGILNCVTLTKSILGIRAWRVVTPYGLYRYLQRKEGVSTNVVPTGTRKIDGRKEGRS